MSTPTPHPGPKPPQRGHYRKGQIWMVSQDPDHPPVGTEIWSDRPAVIVSANQINDRSGFACVVYLSRSTNKRTTPTHVSVPSPEGGSTMALCEQVHTVDASRLVRRMGQLERCDMQQIDAGIAFALSLGRNPDTYALFRKWESHIKLHGIDLRQEIEALSNRTADDRVQALQRALALMTDQRDAYRQLVQTQGALPAALEDVAESIKEAS